MQATKEGDKAMRVKSVGYLGHPDLPPYVSEFPFHDLTVLSLGDDEVSLIVDDEEIAYAGDGWGLFIEMSAREARLLAIRLEGVLAGRFDQAQTPPMQGGGPNEIVH